MVGVVEGVIVLLLQIHFLYSSESIMISAESMKRNSVLLVFKILLRFTLQKLLKSLPRLLVLALQQLCSSQKGEDFCITGFSSEYHYRVSPSLRTFLHIHNKTPDGFNCGSQAEAMRYTHLPPAQKHQKLVLRPDVFLLAAYFFPLKIETTRPLES